MALFGEATKGEQRRYYRSGWSLSEVPDFILQGIESREFAFDHDGNGPSDRYNLIGTPEELERYLHNRSPFSAYCSVAFYGRPEGREGIFRTELAFDIDAKDLPVRSCDCPPGEVCRVCLEDAKKLALEYMDCLGKDFALKDIHLIYSGRGYHIRVFDEEISMITSSDRRKILDYVSGGVVPPPSTGTKSFPSSSSPPQLATANERPITSSSSTGFRRTGPGMALLLERPEGTTGRALMLQYSSLSGLRSPRPMAVETPPSMLDVPASPSRSVRPRAVCRPA